MEKRNSLIGSRDMRETRPRIQDSIQRSALHIMLVAQQGLITASTVMYMPPDTNANCLNVTDPMLIVSIARPFGAVQAPPSIINHHGMPYKPKSPSLAH